MSLFARYNDWFLGGLIGHPKLTAQQWSEIRRIALGRFGVVRRLAVGLSFGVVAVAPMILGVNALETLLAGGRLAPPTFLMQLVGIVTLIALAQESMFRVMPKRLIRTAANELGLVRVCLNCGYDLKGSAGGDADVCPECGTKAE